jgi:hypothetical protein
VRATHEGWGVPAPPWSTHPHTTWGGYYHHGVVPIRGVTTIRPRDSTEAVLLLLVLLIENCISIRLFNPANKISTLKPSYFAIC